MVILIIFTQYVDIGSFYQIHNLICKIIMNQHDIVFRTMLTTSHATDGVIELLKGTLTFLIHFSQGKKKNPPTSLH